MRPPAIRQETANEYREGGTTSVMPPAPARGFDRLEPDDGKLSSPVLRGGNDGNVVSLPD